MKTCARAALAAIGREAEVALAAIGGDHLVAHVIDHLAAGDFAVNPVGLDFRNGAEDHAEQRRKTPHEKSQLAALQNLN